MNANCKCLNFFRLNLVLWLGFFFLISPDLFSQLSGTYTINSGAGASVTNYRSFSALVSDLSMGTRSDGGTVNGPGVAGPVTINVTAGSGPYTEQLNIPSITGTNSLNRITINGNGQVLRFAPNSSDLHIIRFNGAAFITIDSLQIVGTDPNFGWGIHFTQGADSNVINRCTIDLGAVTSLASNNSAGVVFSNSNTNPLFAGMTGFGNIISNNRIRGSAAGGPVYGIAVAGNSVVPANNRFENNIITDYYIGGIYSTSASDIKISGNDISRPNRIASSTCYGIRIINGNNYNVVISGNRVHNPFGGNPSSNSTYHGINLSSVNNTALTPSVITNNLLYNFNGNGAVYGIYSASNNFTKIFHNTISIDNAASSGAAYGMFHTTAPTSAEYKNNIVSISRGGSANKWAMYFNTAGPGYVSDYNVYYLNTTNGNVGYYPFANFPTLASWKTANGNAFDSNSIFVNPWFENAAAGKLKPSEVSINNKGDNLLTAVPHDIMGVARTANPDPGAFEFTPLANDAGVFALINPLNPLSTGVQNVAVSIRNFGSDTLRTATIHWTVNGATQTPFPWTGAVAAGNTSGAIVVGNFNFNSSQLYQMRFWTRIPNGVADPKNDNDTLLAKTCGALSGAFTINKAVPSNGTNFNSFSEALEVLYSCGISGPTLLTVAPGTYTEQIVFNGNIPGASAINTLTIDGVDTASRKITFASFASDARHTIRIFGARHIHIKNLQIEGTGSFGWGVHIMNNGTYSSDSNSVKFCRLTLPELNNMNYGGIIVSGSTTSAVGTGFTANHLDISNNFVNGGYYGLTIFGASTTSSLYGNKITNNTFSNNYFYGVYLRFLKSPLVSGNRIVNLGINTNPLPYGIYIVNCDSSSRIVKNTIANQSGGYGIYFTLNTSTASARSVIANNSVQIGMSNYTVNGIFVDNSMFSDIVYNSVNITSTSGTASGLYVYCGNSALYNNIRILNNNAVNMHGGYAVWINGPDVATISASISASNFNNYFGTAAYPIRRFNVIYPNIQSYQGAIFAGNDVNSRMTDPEFFSVSDLRTLKLEMDSSATPFAGIVDDLNGVLRNTIKPDAGAFEFETPAWNIGVVRILEPVLPMTPGLRNVKVLIKNHGRNTVTSATVGYFVGSTQHTRIWTGSLASGMTDSVVFNATSGPGGTSQQYNFPATLTTLVAFTHQPNGNPDAYTPNDTLSTVLCGNLSGVYTINPAGSGSTNFTSFNAAVNALNCGVNGPVTFNVSPGVYNEQVTINQVPGANSTNRVTFQSSTSNPADVTLTSSNSSTIANYTVNVNGAAFITFNRMTLTNSNANFARVINIQNNGGVSNSNEIIIQNCRINGIQNSLSSLDFAVIYVNGGNPSNIRILNNRISHGSYGIYMNGQSIINQFSNGMVIDSNSLDSNFSYGANLTFLNSPIITNNVVNGSGNTNGMGFYMSSIANATRFTTNRIDMPSGNYGIYLVNCNGYNELGTALYANNIIAMRHATLTTYGVFMSNSANHNFNYNSISLQTTSTASRAFWTFSNAPTTYFYNNNSVENNIFSAKGGYAAFYNGSDLPSTQATFLRCNHNVYFSTGTNLTHIFGTNYQAGSFGAFQNGLYSTSDVNSVVCNPSFFSATDLRTYSSCLNNTGRPIVGVTTDFTGKLRNGTNPDPGAFEFSLDAGVSAILEPFGPVTCANNNVSVKLVVRNYGDNPLTNLPVQVNITGAISLALNEVLAGPFAGGSTDTIVLSQKFSTLSGGVFNLKAFTQLPGDENRSNDTAVRSISVYMPIISGDISVCPSATINYSVPANTGNTRIWTVTGGTIASGQGTTSITVNWGGSGTGNVSVYDSVHASGCVTRHQINVNISIPTPVISGPVSVCELTSETYSTPSVPGHIYTWTANGGTIISGQGTASVNVSWNAAGSGDIFVRDSILSSGCATTTAPFAVTIITKPSPAVSGKSSVCASATESYTTPFNSGRSYSWVVTGGVIVSGQNTSSITVNWGTGSTGNVSVTDSVNSTGCKVTSAVMIVAINPKPAPAISGLSTVCQGTATNYSTPSGAGHSWFWTVTGGNIISGQGSSSVSVIWSNPGSGSIIVTDTNTVSGCYASSALLNTNINPVPSTYIGEDTSFCSGNFINLDGGSGFSNYEWKYNGAVVSNARIFKADKNGTYSVKSTDSKGCVAMDTMNLTVHALPVVSLGGNKAVCAPNTVVLDAGPGFVAYLWQDASKGQTFEAGTAGKYKVTVSDNNGCFNSDSMNLTVNNKPNAGFNFTPNPGMGGQVSFSPVTISGVTYNWNFGDGNNSTLASPTHTYTANGTYSITLIVTAPSGCTDTVTKVYNLSNVSARGIFDDEFKMQVYPNPFVNSTVISYSLPQAAEVSLMLFDVRGALVHQSVSLTEEKGSHKLEINAGELKLPGGVYMFKLIINGQPIHGRIVKVD